MKREKPRIKARRFKVARVVIHTSARLDRDRIVVDYVTYREMQAELKRLRRINANYAAYHSARFNRDILKGRNP